jgi:hypothetical protein
VGHISRYRWAASNAPPPPPPPPCSGEGHGADRGAGQSVWSVPGKSRPLRTRTRTRAHFRGRVRPAQYGDLGSTRVMPRAPSPAITCHHVFTSNPAKQQHMRWHPTSKLVFPSSRGPPVSRPPPWGTRPCLPPRCPDSTARMTSAVASRRWPRPPAPPPGAPEQKPHPAAPSPPVTSRGSPAT